MATEAQTEPLAKRAKGNRDEHGRYLPGHSIPGPGAPYARRVAELRTALLDAVSFKDVSAMVAAMIRKAKEGDAACFRVLSPYLFGKPTDAPKGDEEDEGTAKGPIVVQFETFVRLDGSEIQPHDPDWPEEIVRERAARRNVITFPGEDAGA